MRKADWSLLILASVLIIGLIVAGPSLTSGKLFAMQQSNTGAQASPNDTGATGNNPAGTNDNQNPGAVQGSSNSQSNTPAEQGDQGDQGTTAQPANPNTGTTGGVNRPGYNAPYTAYSGAGWGWLWGIIGFIVGLIVGALAWGGRRRTYVDRDNIRRAG